MPLSGGFAVLLLATLPGFFTFCRSSLSEISASALIVSAFMFAYLGLKEERRWKIYLSAVFSAFHLISGCSHFSSCRCCWRWLFSQLRECVWLASPLRCTPDRLALAASPVLALNTIQLHSPFKTGYDFWVPYWSESHLLFSLHYIPTNVARLWREFALRPNGFFAANIFGTGTCFVPAFILLIAWDLFGSDLAGSLSALSSPA